MRIDGFQNIPAILQSFNNTGSPKTSSGNEAAAPASSVSLSAFAEVLQKLQRESANAAGTRAAKVDNLAQQVQTGNLNVNLEKLASKLVENQVI